MCERFLATGSPFSTPEYQKLYEQDALANIKKELVHWQGIQTRTLMEASVSALVVALAAVWMWN